MIATRFEKPGCMCIPAAQKRTAKQSNEKIDVFGWAFSFLQKIKGKNKTKHVL
jgi:hypothetical protein